MNRFAWLKAVNRADLLPRCTKVAVALAIDFYNEETGRLDPGLTTLADATGQTLDTVKRALRDLIEAGWLARTEGRGRGNKTEYTLLSPGKVVAISSAKKGADVPLQKGGTGAPLGQEKGAPVHGKGGTGAPFHIKEEQSLEQRAGAPDRWRNHRFTGQAFAGPALVPSSESIALGEWGRWLRKHGFPAMSEFPIARQGPKRGGEYFALPWKRPPDDADLTQEAKTQEALAYFSDMIAPEGPRHAAI